MSIFENKFKLNRKDKEEEKIELLMKVTNGKMSLKETKRVYSLLKTDVFSKIPKNMQILEAVELLNREKGKWLTNEEKENFIAGAWMFDTLKDKNQKYINLEQLKYVKQAVLGAEFKNAKEGKYYVEYNEFRYKY